MRIIEEPCLYYGPQHPKANADGYYPGGDHFDVYELRCDCGYQWQVRKRDFEGEYTVRNCGRPECEYANAANTKAATIGRPPGRPRSVDRGTPVQLYIPMSLYFELADKAKQNSTSISKQAVAWMRKGAESEASTDLVPATGEPTDW